MNYNKEKLGHLVQSDSFSTLHRNKERIKNRAVLRESRKLAFKILNKIEALGWTKSRLAEEMGYADVQQVTTLLTGKENHTQQTLIKIHEVLGIPTLASHVEQNSSVTVCMFSVKSQISQDQMTEFYPQQKTSMYKVNA